MVSMYVYPLGGSGGDSAATQVARARAGGDRLPPDLPPLRRSLPQCSAVPRVLPGVGGGYKAGAQTARVSLWGGPALHLEGSQVRVVQGQAEPGLRRCEGWEAPRQGPGGWEQSGCSAADLGCLGRFGGEDFRETTT